MRANGSAFCYVSLLFINFKDESPSQRRKSLNILFEFSNDFLVCLVHLVHIDAGEVDLRSMLGIMAQALADDVERNVALARCTLLMSDSFFLAVLKFLRFPYYLCIRLAASQQLKRASLHSICTIFATEKNLTYPKSDKNNGKSRLHIQHSPCRRTDR